MNPDLVQVLAQIKRRTAIHEAAHAVIAYDMGWQIVFIEMCDVDPEVLPEHGSTWAFTRVGIPAGRRHDIEGIVQILAGHVAEQLFGPDADDDEVRPVDGVLRHVRALRDDEGDGVGDFAEAWKLLEVNLELPSVDDGIDAEHERDAALEWAVRCTCRLTLPRRDNILRVADRVEILGRGQRLDGDDIIALIS